MAKQREDKISKVKLLYPDGTTGVRYSLDDFRLEDEKVDAPVAIDYETSDKLSLHDMNSLLSLMKAGSIGSTKLIYEMDEVETEMDAIGKEPLSKERMLEIEEEEQEMIDTAEFDLDLALDTYDPTFPGYEISADAFEFFSLMRLVAGQDFEFNTPIAHYFMVDMLLGNITEKSQFPYSEEVCETIEIDKLFIGFMQSRGLAKSTIVISFFGVYSAMKGELPNGLGKVYFYLLLAASTKGGARVNALAVRSMCEDSEYLKEYFESMRFTETESEFIRKGDGPKKNRSFLLRYQGINTGVRGSRYGERRPCCHIRGTEVTTEYGTYPVEDHPGYKSEGHFEQCTEVKLRGLTNSEVVSRDHSYWTKICVGNKCVMDGGNKLPRYSEHAPKWTQAQDLTDRHWVGEAIDYSIKKVQPIKYMVRDGVSGREENGQLHGPKYKSELKLYEPMLDDDWWWLYGLWLGDGSLGNASSNVKDRSNRSSIVWYIADAQRDTVGKKAIHILTRLGIHHAEAKARTQTGCYSILIYDSALADWLRTQKTGNSRKTMPNWVLNIDLEKQKQLLLGYIAADGYIDTTKRNNAIRINSVNYDVLRQLQKISNRLGMPTHIRNTKQAGIQLFSSTGKEHQVSHQWELRLKENCASVLGINEIVNSTKVKYKQVYIKDGMLWRQVKQVRLTEKEYELVPIQCDNKKLEKLCGTVHAYETEFGISKNCLIFDDAILNTAAAYSKVLSENLDEIIHSDATNALKGGGKGRVILCFTPFSYSDVNTKAVLQGAFTPVIIPMARMFDADAPIKSKDIESTWEAMHPAQSIAALVKKAKKTKKLKLFMQERMLRLTSGSERLVPDSAIQFCDMKPIVNNLDYYNVYITTDFTTTSGEESDFSGRATWAVSNNEDWFMLDLALRKMTMTEQYKGTLDEAARYKRKGKNVEIGVEVDGNQQAHIHSLEKEMMIRGDWYSFAKPKGDPYATRKGILSKNTGVNKHERFRIAVNSVLIPQKMWLPEHLRNTPDMIEFLAQIKGATHKAFTRADDGCDLLTMCFVSMNVIYPTEMGSTSNTPKNGSIIDDPFFGDDDGGYRNTTGYSSYN